MTLSWAPTDICTPRCMKNGRVIESGTHQDLIARGGEYTKLFNIQAKAFTEASLLSLAIVYFMVNILQN